MSFENLERDPVGEVRKMYEALDLGDFGCFEPTLHTLRESACSSAFRDLPFSRGSVYANASAVVRDVIDNTQPLWSAASAT
jgi:hypothetical protein